jgi:hypothetical protein
VESIAVHTQSGMMSSVEEVIRLYQDAIDMMLKARRIPPSSTNNRVAQFVKKNGYNPGRIRISMLALAAYKGYALSAPNELSTTLKEGRRKPNAFRAASRWLREKYGYSSTPEQLHEFWRTVGCTDVREMVAMMKAVASNPLGHIPRHDPD